MNPTPVSAGGNIFAEAPRIINAVAAISRIISKIFFILVVVLNSKRWEI